MTKLTTSECIEVLDALIAENSVSSSFPHPHMAAIRAKLLAVDEMAKALEAVDNNGDLCVEGRKGSEALLLVAQALAAYSAAGGK